MKPRWVSALLLFGSAVSSCDPNVDYLSAGDGSAGSAPAVAGAPSAGAPSTVGNAGSGGEPSVAGSSAEGEAGATGEAGSAGEPSEPSEPRLDIVTQDGKVVAGSNSFEIDGEVRKYAADPNLLEGNFAGSKRCVKGTLLAATNSNYDRYWGGGIQFALKQSPAGGAGVVYDATAHGLAGFQIALSGSKLPPTLRLQYKHFGNVDSYCKEIVSIAGGVFDFLVREAVRNCWVPGGAAIPPTQLENLELHVVPPVDKNVDIDFCVTRLTVIPAAR